jgi:hypothetical protein
VPRDAQSDPGAPSEPALPPSDPSAWQACGPHRYCTRDDVLFWQPHGSMDLEQLKRLFAERLALQVSCGRSFIVVDAHELGSVPPEIRRYAIHYRPDPPFVGATVIFGASVLARTAVSLITAAARLIGRSESEMKTLFFVADEQEAAKVIARRRRVLLSTTPRT